MEEYLEIDQVAEPGESRVASVVLIGLLRLANTSGHYEPQTGEENFTREKSVCRYNLVSADPD